MSFLGNVGSALAGGAGDIFNAGVNLWAAHKAQQHANDELALANGQFNAQMDETIQRRVADGLKAGINPLAAIGASANVSPTIHAGGSSGGYEFYSRAAEHLSRLFERKQEDDIEYDSQAKQLDLESKRLENRILRNRALESEQNLKAVSKTGSATEVPNMESDMEEKPNRIGDVPLFRVAYDLQGRPRLVANQDVMEMDSDNAGYLSSIKHAISQGFVDKVSGRITSDQYRMMLDDMYYNMYGRHIVNLGDLYFSPAEAAIAAAGLYGQVKGK